MEKTLKDWRPDNWRVMRDSLANTPMTWSTSGPFAGHTEQVVEATASRILEEWEKECKRVAEQQANPKSK